MYAIGIDMSKDTFHACFKDDFVKVFKNTDEGIEQFMTLMEDLGLSHKKTRVGVEATGVYHLLLAVTLTEHSWDLYVINPLESHKMITSSLRTVKTDTKDAIKIREMIILGKGYLFGDTAEIIALKALVVERTALVEMRRATRQRVRVNHLKSEAIDIPLFDNFSDVLEVLDIAIKRIEDRMGDYKEDTQNLLRSIPGVGVTTAATLIAFVGDVERFSTPEKLVAFIGVDPRVYQSGTSVHGKGYISKRGNKYLRGILFNAAFIAKRYNPTLGEYYDKKISEGKHHTSVICAIERKLIHIIYAVWKRDTPFEKR